MLDKLKSWENEKVLSDKEKEQKENEQLFKYLETLTKEQLVWVLKQLALDDPNIRKEYEAFKLNNSNNVKEKIKQKNIQENKEVSKKLNNYEKLTNDLIKNIEQLQKSKDETISLAFWNFENSITEFLWFWSPEQTFNEWYDILKWQAEIVLKKLVWDTKWKTLNPENQKKYDNIKETLKEIINWKLKDTSIFKKYVNSYKELPNDIKSRYIWVKWVNEWFVEWILDLFKWIPELVVLLWKWIISSLKYIKDFKLDKKRINE